MLSEIHRANIVQSTDMVIMLMCKQDCIQPLESEREHLLSEVWSDIYQDSSITGTNHD
jgi:hypothetical protein